MALSEKDLVTGRRVRVEAFEAFITADGLGYDEAGNILPETYEGALRVRSSSSGNSNTHYVNPSQLSLPVPFEDGALYVSNGGAVYFYEAGADGAPGRWAARLRDGSKSTVTRMFSQVLRPLRPITVGDVVPE